MYGNRIISICIGTYRRNLLLNKLLLSLLRQSVPLGWNAEVIVIDNDINGGAEAIVKNYSNNDKYAIIYDIVKAKNISMVRNAAVRYARGCLVIFIDDDEYVDDDWLRSFVETSILYPNAVLVGPVISYFDNDGCGWTIENGLIQRTQYKELERRNCANTGNVLVPKSVLSLFDNIFDERFGLTGGEDYEFFKRVFDSGIEILWINKARVYEYTPKLRTTLFYLIKRNYRTGSTFAFINYRNASVIIRLLQLLKRICILSAIMLIIMPIILFNKVYSAKLLLKAASSIGQILGIFSYRYEMYK